MSQSPQTVFTYQALNRSGQTVTGEISAANVKKARMLLLSQGHLKVQCRKKKGTSKSLFGKQRIKAADIATFTRQMATMLTSGIPLVQAFDIVAKSLENPTMTAVVQTIRSDVEEGHTFAEALSKHPLHFDDLFCNLIATGEASGSLEGMLDKVATYKEKTESLKRKIKKAMFYPAAVVVIALLVTTILLVFVVPQFEALFEGFGAELPAFTRMVVDLSEFIQTRGWLLVVALAGLVQGIRFLNRNVKSFQDGRDRFLLKVPIFGGIVTKGIWARYARTLATTFAAGVPLVEALAAVSGAMGNVIYREAVIQIKEEVAVGSQLHQAMEHVHLFPPLMLQLVTIGEESGALDTMLAKVADIFEEEVDLAVDSLSSLLEPLIMAVLGVLIGGLVVAMYLPIFQMGSVI